MNEDLIKTLVLLEVILAPSEETRIPILYKDSLLKSFIEKEYLSILETNVIDDYCVLEAVNEKRSDIVKIISKFADKIIQRDVSLDSIPYDIITGLIFEIGSRGTQFKDNNDDQFDGTFTGSHQSSTLINKIRRNIRLSKTQYNQIMKASEEAKEISNQSLKTIEQVKSVKGEIYSEFIAILGVFSALIFGLFGGFEGIKGILSLFKNATNFGVISMYCGLVVLIIVTISFALIQFTGRLIGKSVKSCCSSDECNHKWFRKYKIYTICVGVSLGMILLGMIYDHFKLFIM